MLKSYARVALLLICLSATCMSNASEMFDLRIPSAKASVALKTLAQQTGYSLLFQNAEIESVITNAVKGRFTLKKALNQLLEGTDLSSSVTKGRVIAVSPLSKKQKQQLEASMRKTNKKSLFKSLSLFALSVFSVSGQAQDGTSTPRGLEEIVVTARYKAESLQDTPISITAFSASQLESRGITDIVDISAAAPNVSMAPGGARNGKAAVAFIRGVGQFDSAFAYEPGVGMYVDDVYYQTLFGSQFTLGDVDSIQILRGPQGTLFGKNTEGGAVVVNMVDPKGDGSGYIKMGYGNYNHRMVKAAFDASLIEDKLFMRASYGAENQDGYVDIIDYPCAFPGNSGSYVATRRGDCKVGTQGSVDVQTGRVAFKYLASDDLTVRFSADMLQDRADGPPDVLVGIAQPDRIAAYNQNALIPAFGIPYDDRFLPPNNYTTYQAHTNAFNGLSTPNAQTMDSWGTSLKFDWTLPNDMLFKSITAYREYEGQSNYNIGQSPVPISFGLLDSSHEQFSQEFRLSGRALGSKLNWTVGAYYATGDSWLGGFYDTPAFNFSFTLDDDIPQESKAVFAHVTYDITDQLSLELGLRHSEDEKTYTFRHEIIPNTGFYAPPISSTTTESSNTDPKIGLQYQWTDDLMTYVQYSTGYKAGGINAHPTSVETVVPFDPETLEAYEIGIKSEWFDNRLRVNAAAFYNDFEDLQLVVFVPGESGGVQSNAGHAVIQGLELDIQAEPVDNLLIEAGLGFIDFEYKELGGAAFDPINNPGGLRLSDVGAYTPDFKGYIGIQYTKDMGKNGRLIPRLDYTYQSKMYFDQQNVEFASQGSYDLLNARLTWESEDDKWSGNLEVRNLTDEFYWSNMANLSGNWGALSGTPSMPRTYMVSVKRNF